MYNISTTEESKKSDDYRKRIIIEQHYSMCMEDQNIFGPELESRIAPMSMSTMATYDMTYTRTAAFQIPTDNIIHPWHLPVGRANLL